jgi:hypothetical protein
LRDDGSDAEDARWTARASARPRKGIRALFRTFVQIEQTWTIDYVIAEADKVVVRATNSCIQDSFLDVPAHGKRQTFSATFIHRIGGGKIVETWRNADDLGRLLQLGARIGPAPSDRDPWADAEQVWRILNHALATDLRTEAISLGTASRRLASHQDRNPHGFVGASLAKRPDIRRCHPAHESREVRSRRDGALGVDQIAEDRHERPVDVLIHERSAGADHPDCAHEVRRIEEYA